MQTKEKFDHLRYYQGVSALKKKDYNRARKHFEYLLPTSQLDSQLNEDKPTSQCMCDLAYNYGLLCKESFTLSKNISDLLTAKKLFQISYRHINKKQKNWKQSAWVVKQQLLLVLETTFDFYLTANTELVQNTLKNLLNEYNNLFSENLLSLAPRHDNRTKIISEMLSEIIGKICNVADEAYDNDDKTHAIEYYHSSLNFLNFQIDLITKLENAEDLQSLKSKIADIYFNLILIYEKLKDIPSVKKYAEIALKLYHELLQDLPENESYQKGISLINQSLHDLENNSDSENPLSRNGDSTSHAKNNKRSATCIDDEDTDTEANNISSDNNHDNLDCTELSLTKKRRISEANQQEASVANIIASMIDIIPSSTNLTCTSSSEPISEEIDFIITVTDEPKTPQTPIANELKTPQTPTAETTISLMETTEFTTCSRNEFIIPQSLLEKLSNGDLCEQSLLKLDESQLVAIANSLSDEIDRSKSAYEKYEQNIQKILHDTLSKKCTKLTELYYEIIGFNVLTQKETTELDHIKNIVLELEKDSDAFIKNLVSNSISASETEIKKIDHLICKLNEKIQLCHEKRSKLASISQKLGFHQTCQNNLNSTNSLKSKLENKYIEDKSSLHLSQS